MGLDSVCHLVSVDLALLANVTAVTSWREIPALSEGRFGGAGGISLGIKLGSFLSRIVLFLVYSY